MSLIVQAQTKEFGLILVEVDLNHIRMFGTTFKGTIIYIDHSNEKEDAYVGFASNDFDRAFYNYPNPATTVPMPKALTINLIL
jgi:hypothetical protein